MSAGGDRRVGITNGVEVALTIAAKHHLLRQRILNGKTESVKLDGTLIVTSELSNRKKVMNYMRNNKDIIKEKFSGGCMKRGVAARGDREARTVTNSDGRVRGRVGGHEHTVIGRHVRCGATVHAPGDDHGLKQNQGPAGGGMRPPWKPPLCC